MRMAGIGYYDAITGMRRRRQHTVTVVAAYFIHGNCYGYHITASQPAHVIGHYRFKTESHYATLCHIILSRHWRQSVMRAEIIYARMLAVAHYITWRYDVTRGISSISIMLVCWSLLWRALLLLSALRELRRHLFGLTEKALLVRYIAGHCQRA